MNIELFIACRKALGLSQKALADGICTQATLSKFENNGKAPAIRIVAQLCQRLNLQLEDVFPTERVADAAVLKILEQVEFDSLQLNIKMPKYNLKRLRICRDMTAKPNYNIVI